MTLNNRRKPKLDPAIAAFEEAVAYLSHHPMFSGLIRFASIVRREEVQYPANGWANVDDTGAIYVHPKRRGETEEWIYVLAHCLLHLGFGHFQAKVNQTYWNIACDCTVSKFLRDLKLGKAPDSVLGDYPFSAADEDSLYQRFCEQGVPAYMQQFGVGDKKQCDMLFASSRAYRQKVDWGAVFGYGLSAAVSQAVEAAAGYQDFMGIVERLTAPQKARKWFINHYPLLGSLATGFSIVEDAVICQRLDISIAAIDVVSREVFFNPAAGLSENECRFVMAHELLHAGLLHHERCQGRDPYYWNVACDYVINQWLVDMRVGDIPQLGLLLDPELKGLSAESIYDRIVTDLRMYRKLQTFRGFGKGDILDRGSPSFWESAAYTDLDSFFRNALSQGLIYHQDQQRGFLPAGLVEEIRALGQPPIPWDVELGRWFDSYFEPLEKVRSYARISRRQSSTPDIPRPKWINALGSEEGRTFGVILDTSGSMDKKMLGKALGAIASYAISREVPAVRVVFCDAIAYDEGYMLPEDILDRVRVKGRGGTILQPGIDLLDSAKDFPKQGPLLIITDGYCDRLTIHRNHAFLLPKGAKLPFVPKGPVFRVE